MAILFLGVIEKRRIAWMIQKTPQLAATYPQPAT
jgi:hypothetical protein